MIKVTALLIRRPELSHEQFMRHWVDVHAPLVDALPGLKRYVQNYIQGEQVVPVPNIGLALDGIAELWFEDRPSFERAFNSPEGQRLAWDGAQFIGRISFFIIDERVVIS